MTLRKASLLILFFLSLSVKASEIDSLKYMLKAREAEPKIYIPEAVVSGNEIDLTVEAPGAESVTLLESLEPGETSLAEIKDKLGLSVNPVGGVEGKTLKLGSDYKLIESKINSNSNQSFRVNFRIPANKDPSMIDKSCSFEALVNYRNELGELSTKRAVFFGSNANFSNNNAVKILPVPKSKSNVGNFARSMIPNMGGMFTPQN